jgi:hypothetical protein
MVAILVPWIINTLTYFLLREDHFPFTLALTPIGGEGKRWDSFEALPSGKTLPVVGPVSARRRVYTNEQSKGYFGHSERSEESLF